MPEPKPTSSEGWSVGVGWEVGGPRLDQHDTSSRTVGQLTSHRLQVPYKLASWKARLLWGPQEVMTLLPASHDEQPQMPRPPPPPPPPTPPAQPQQHQQRLGSSTDDKLRHSLSYSSGGGPTSRSTSSGVAAAAAAANALASPFLTRPPHSAAGGGGTAVALSGSPSVQLTSYGSQNGPGRCSGPVSPQVCRSVRLRADRLSDRASTAAAAAAARRMDLGWVRPPRRTPREPPLLAQYPPPCSFLAPLIHYQLTAVALPPTAPRLALVNVRRLAAPTTLTRSPAQDLSQLQEVVLDRGGLVLTRIWCLYEIWQTVRQKGPEALRALTGPLEFEELVRVWGELEVERAQSACHDLDRARAAVPRTPLHGERAYRAAFLLRTAGSGAAALGAAREAADVFCGCLGPAHPDTLRALRCVAGCHKDMGSTRQAVGLLEQQVIPFLDEAYGVGHTESCALDELGMLYYTLGEYDTAYDMLLAALSRRLRRLQMCAATTVVAPQLAAALAPLTGDPLAALLAALRALVSELAAEAVEAEARRAGAVAPLPSPPPGGDGGDGSVPLRGDVRTSVELVGLSLHSLGLVQRERAGRCRSAGASSGLMREARELMEVSVELLQVSSSEARGLTALDARANLAALVMEGGKYLAAEQLLRDNLTLTERVYGKDHPHTATAANNLALCLKRQRSSSPHKAQEALALYGRCLEVCGASLGESHPETLVAATNMGVLLADQLAESAPPELRDHGLVLECREGVQRVGERMEEAARAGQVSPGNCCVVS
ncbi:kinesin [Volvox carteri f. nagariensis]|uniref:Kinesin n=1 Tax=Volvox carteri f. nagariensis TaxID=3068 RepID=D8U7D4_VOLCA|nr:kinesin [Volvox carteri f. nagariensis]EFJ44402.1 kinesin [Volvox carteri f. nagariensis]|eukprot:XP_002954509.1 kinesin [Volvox carteri f. nagariensis]